MSLDEIRIKEEDKFIKQEPQSDIDPDLSTAGLGPEVRVKAESEYATDIPESKEDTEGVRRDELAGYTGEVKDELDLASELLHQLENAHIALESLSDIQIKQETNPEISRCIKQIVQQECIVKLERIPIDSLKKSQRHSFARLTVNHTENDKRTRKKCNKNTLEVAKNVYICNNCNKQFAKRVTIIKHLLNKVCAHKSEKSYACEICQKKFPYPSSLRNHKVTHSGEKRFKCELCGIKCSTEKNLKHHVFNHMNDRPFSCDICNRQFVRERYLISHKLSHTGEKPFECEICGKRLKHKRTLVDHLRTHEGYSHEKLLSCDFCEIKFSRKSHLTIHERSHTGEKPFPCEVCKKSFTSNSVLTTHMRIHTGEKPYACDMCPMQFSSSGILGVHKQRHSKGKYTT
ncbi:zinc finger protein OZF-like [Cydia pomonella]|uniref:zinc finger protein OZF-like n=1 Tax=Cydia pomonella TaxID=82600 RepID=UPI002ADE368B|nr:zinc finger protein OZF-like [Cydia pomonella]